MTVQVQTLALSDAPAMAILAKQAHSHPMTQNVIESCFGTLYTCLGIVVDAKLLGFAIVHQIFEDATLMDICVAPEEQGAGHGRTLLKAVIDKARVGGAETLLLEVRASGVVARKLYIKSGFVETGCRKDYYQCLSGHEDAVLMALSLTDLT